MIVAVSGGKGGVGKSTVALNLANELDAVVVDGDLSTADLPAGTGPDLHDVLADRVDPIEAVESHGTVKLLPCGRTLEGARASDLDQLAQTVRRLDRQYGRVVIDCPAGLARDVGREIQCADITVLVTEPDPAALDNAYQTATVAVELETPVAAVILNKTSSDEYEELEATVEKRCSAPVSYIPYREEIATAQEHWHPVREAYPQNDVLDRFESIASTVSTCGERVTANA